MAEKQVKPNGPDGEPKSEAAPLGMAGEAAGGQPATEAQEDARLLDQLRADLEEAKDRVLRSQAELDNYRKRAAREVEEHRRYAEFGLIHDLLPVIDNIERAIAASETTQDAAALLQGVRLMAQQFETILQRHHATRIPALHLPFDPHLHQAIAQQATDEFPPNTVVVVSQPGFKLHDRVVRPSQVIVSKPIEEEPEAETAD